MNTEITEKIKSDEILNRICDNFDADVYLVGGSVRDFALGNDTFDRDIVVTNTDAREFALNLAEFFSASFVPLDEENKIYRIVLKDKVNFIDVTNSTGSTIEEDLGRRDLTINAIAVNLKTLQVIDPFNGLKDINSKRINLINEKNFTDDPLRLLRVYRFQSVLGFNPADDVTKAVKNNSELILRSAKERISYELLKLFGGKYAHSALVDMDKAGLTEIIFPVMKDVKKVPSNSHHHLDLFNHSIETVKQIQLLYDDSEQVVKDHLDSVDFGGAGRLAHLKLAGFLHDIGKFSTWTIEDGKHRFIKHDDVGSKMAVKILKELKFSKKQIEYITEIIKYHIYPSHLMHSSEVTDKIMMRFVRRMGDNSIDNIIIAQADRLSARGEEITDEIVKTNIASLNRLMEFYLKNSDSEPLMRLLDGYDVMKILDIPPSPKLGAIMEALYDAQVNGDVLTREDAVSFIKSIE